MHVSLIFAGQGIHILPQEVAGKVQEIQGQKNYDDQGWKKAAQVSEAQEMVCQERMEGCQEAMAFWHDH